MKRVLAVLLICALALLGWMVSRLSTAPGVGAQAQPTPSGAERETRDFETPEPVAPVPAAPPVLESVERTEIAPTAAPTEHRLTLLGAVRDRRGRAIERFGVRGIRKDASNAFVEERVWDVAQHAGGEFALEALEPHAWELAPFAEGYKLERSERFVRSNARPVVFRMSAEVEVSGIALDARDRPVAGATVKATERADALLLGDRAQRGFETTTDDGGRFWMKLDQSNYAVRASRDGFVDSAEQLIEIEDLAPRGGLELRLQDGCSVRIAFDRAALGSAAPAAAIALPLRGGGGPQPVTVDAAASDVTLRGLAPGWQRLILVTGSPSDAAYTAAVEVEFGEPLEVTFEVRPTAPVAIQLRPLQPSAEALDFQQQYEFLPTLPNLNWLELSRKGSRVAVNPGEQHCARPASGPRQVRGPTSCSRGDVRTIASRRPLAWKRLEARRSNSCSHR